MISWCLLIISGVLEAFWPMALKASDGFTKPAASVVAVGIIGISLFCFSIAIKEISPSLAYIVFVGMGAIGVSIVGIIVYDETLSVLKTFFIFLILAGVIGLHQISKS